MSIIPNTDPRHLARSLAGQGYSTYSPAHVEHIPAEALEGFSATLEDGRAISLAEMGWLVVPAPEAAEVDVAIATALNQPMRAALRPISRLRLAMFISNGVFTCVVLALLLAGILPVGR